MPPCPVAPCAWSTTRKPGSRASTFSWWRTSSTREEPSTGSWTSSGRGARDRSKFAPCSTSTSPRRCATRRGSWGSTPRTSSWSATGWTTRKTSAICRTSRACSENACTSVEQLAEQQEGVQLGALLEDALLLDPPDPHPRGLRVAHQPRERAGSDDHLFGVRPGAPARQREQGVHPGRRDGQDRKSVV